MSNSERKNKTPISVDDARALLRASNLRSTPSRLVVIERLSISQGPVSHAELADELVPLGYDKSTIYRVLIELAESGIVSRIDAGDHAWRFELKKGDHQAGEHPHFVCNDCGKIECLPDVQVSFKQTTKKNPKGKERQIDEIFLKGTCGDCAD